MTGQFSDKKELTWQEWEKMEKDGNVLVDLRRVFDTLFAP